MGKLVLPPLVGAVTGIIQFYQALPMDAITAQIGMVYCFLGGYYPTLFSSLQAANFIKLWHFQYRGTATEEIRFDNFGHAIVVVGPLHRRLRTAVRMANHGHVPHSYFAFD